METFTQLFGDLLAFVYHCFDRICLPHQRCDYGQYRKHLHPPLEIRREGEHIWPSSCGT